MSVRENKALKGRRKQQPIEAAYHHCPTWCCLYVEDPRKKYTIFSPSAAAGTCTADGRSNCFVVALFSSPSPTVTDVVTTGTSALGGSGGSKLLFY